MSRFLFLYPEIYRYSENARRLNRRIHHHFLGLLLWSVYNHFLILMGINTRRDSLTQLVSVNICQIYLGKRNRIQV